MNNSNFYKLVIQVAKHTLMDLKISRGDSEVFELENARHQIKHIRYNFQPIEDYINICFVHSGNSHKIQNICVDIKDCWEFHLTQEKDSSGKVGIYINDFYISEKDMLDFGFDGRAVFTHIHKLKRDYFNE
ncbi:MAG: hypothetical protein GY828_08350 [Candidatus Gracilibacteria bacterium]|nr:hypothetical protein [Candidatus Gracilibacteria bacterium]